MVGGGYTAGIGRIMLLLAFGLYLANVLVGVMAQVWRVHFGWWHHGLYAVVFASAIAAAVVDFHPALLVVLAVLAVFPRARPRTLLHPLLAGVGLLAYAVALALPSA